jgi:large subunit ribosomal protein L24
MPGLDPGIYRNRRATSLWRADGRGKPGHDEWGWAVPKLKVKKGDTIVVISGRDKGKRGEVLRVFPTENRLIVQGVHVARRHTRQQLGNPGGIVDKELTIHVSNVAHVDPQSGKPTRVGYRTLDDGRKVRVARGSGEMIPEPRR